MVNDTTINSLTHPRNPFYLVPHKMYCFHSDHVYINLFFYYIYTEGI